MSILVIAEHDNTELKTATLNTVAAGMAIGGDIDILVAGSDCDTVAESAAQVPGVGKVLLANKETYKNSLAENVGNLVVELAEGYSHILAPATTNGKNYMPRVAAKLDVSQISDISAVVSEDTFERPIYAGNCIATVQSTDSVKVITVRTTGV
jgi:electron transfer flavoprotein alpha subunit